MLLHSKMLLFYHLWLAFVLACSFVIFMYEKYFFGWCCVLVKNAWLFAYQHECMHAIWIVFGYISVSFSSFNVTLVGFVVTVSRWLCWCYCRYCADAHRAARGALHTPSTSKPIEWMLLRWAIHSSAHDNMILLFIFSATQRNWLNFDWILNWFNWLSPIPTAHRARLSLPSFARPFTKQHQFPHKYNSAYSCTHTKWDSYIHFLFIYFLFFIIPFHLVSFGFSYTCFAASDYCCLFCFRVIFLQIYARTRTPLRRCLHRVMCFIFHNHFLCACTVHTDIKCLCPEKVSVNFSQKLALSIHEFH